MGKYIDGFVIPIKQENVEKYRAMAQKAGDVWKEHGALEFYESVGDDLEIRDMLSFKTIASRSTNVNSSRSDESTAAVPFVALFAEPL